MLNPASLLPTSLLKEAEQQYYAQQLQLPEVGHAGQHKLKEAKVLVVGAGGLGSHAFLHLASAGVGTLGICEADILEASNLNRQGLYQYQDIGKPKSIIAAQRLSALNPFIQIQTIPERFSSNNAKRILEQYDLVLECSDNFETQFLINQTALQLGKAAIFTSLYQYEGYVLTLPSAHQASPSTGCLNCLWPETAFSNTDPSRNCHTEGTLSPIAGILGSLQALEALKIILNLPHLAGEMLTLDLLTYSQSRITIPRNPDCPYHINTEAPKTLLKHPSETLSLSIADIKATDTPTIWIQLQSDQPALIEFPLDTLAGKLHLTEAQLSPALFQNTSHSFIVSCPTGIRSKQIVRHLRRQGIQNVYALSVG